MKCDFDTEEALRRLRFNVKAARGKQTFTLCTVVSHSSLMLTVLGGSALQVGCF